MAVDLNAIRAEHERIKSAGQSNFLDNFVPMPEGTGSVVIRLLPPKSGVLPFVATRTHKMNGKNFHCPMTLSGKKWVGTCPICNHYRSLWKQSETAPSKEDVEALQNEARAIKPVERYYWNAIVRSLTNKQGQIEHDVGPKIFSCGKQLQTKLLVAMTGDDTIGIEGLGDITDVTGKEGCDLQVVKRLVKGGGNQEYPNYNDSVFKKPTPAGSEEEIEMWLENLHDLTSLRRVLPSDELAREVRVHRGQEQDPDTAYDVDSMNEADDEPIPAPPVVRQAPKPSVQTPPVQVRPNPTAQVQRPVKPTVVDDDDEALAEQDFLAKLKNM